MNDLYRRSIEIILENQTANGAYIASPNFPTYRFCWFRDGSFTAYAMDLVSEYESSRRFHQWAADRVKDRAGLVHSAIQKAQLNQALREDEVLHTRYRLDGTPDQPGEWPNFQLDGFGTWLWALEQHWQLSGQANMPPDWLNAAHLVAEYLTALWKYPCHDCWEEFPEQVHPHTLAAVYGGLCAYERYSGQDQAEVTTAIRSWLLENPVEFGHFVKFCASPAVDASLLGLAIPYHVISVDDPIMLATVAQIEQTLVQGGGVHRYATDTYYGGGEWILLTAWLAWYYCELACHRPDMASSALKQVQAYQDWIEDQAGLSEVESWLPEQVSSHLNDPTFYPTWLDRWGPIANPLLWSHANYIILKIQRRNIS